MTGESGKDAIIRSGRMLRGKSGAFGGGIYFADKPSDCLRKAHSQGFLVRAEVRMGTALKVTNCNDHTFTGLNNQGCNSVYAPSVFASGAEYVVYNCDQVKVLDIKNTKTGKVIWPPQRVLLATPPGGAFAIGDIIEAKWNGTNWHGMGRGAWFNGRVAKVNGNGTYDIDYCDGDKERNVSEDDVRRRRGGG